MDRQGGRSFFFGSKERAALNDGQICSARPATRTQKVSVFWLLISHVLKTGQPTVFGWFTFAFAHGFDWLFGRSWYILSLFGGLLAIFFGGGLQ